MRLALLYEHPTWSTELVARAQQRTLDLVAFDVASGGLALEVARIGESEAPKPAQVVGLPEDLLPYTRGPVGHGFDLWVNRVNAMPSAGRPASVVAATGHLLLALELRGELVVNGSQTHRIGGSKVAQAALFAQLGMDTPASIAIFEPAQAIAAADRLGFPVLTKPNVGGSGSGIVQHDSPTDLSAAVAANVIDLGIDGTGLVQRVIKSADGLIHRIEMLGADLFYATEQPLQAGAFNYCAADGCVVEPGGGDIKLFTPPPDVVHQAAAVMRAASTQVGGVEYIIDATTGQPTFFDFNPYSNFVTGFDRELGFNPIERYLDFLLTICDPLSAHSAE